MADEIFSKRLQSLLKEQVLTYGSQQSTPVCQLSWPTEKPLPSDNIDVVTNGETTPIDVPRTDLQMQSKTSLNSEALGEVSSLLISIGYILSKEGILTDKYNLQAISKYLNDKFCKISPVTSVPPTENDLDVTVEPVSPEELTPVMENRNFKFNKNAKNI